MKKFFFKIMRIRHSGTAENVALYIWGSQQAKILVKNNRIELTAAEKIELKKLSQKKQDRIRQQKAKDKAFDEEVERKRIEFEDLRSKGIEAVVDFLCHIPEAWNFKLKKYPLTKEEKIAINIRRKKMTTCLSKQGVLESLLISPTELDRWVSDGRIKTLGVKSFHFGRTVWGRVFDKEDIDVYKFQANAFDEPNYRMHFSSDAPIEINALIFAPKLNPEQMGFGKVDPGVSLYCKKVLIDSKPEGLLPDWMRFLKGVVDSADLPLNISRESMQDSALASKIGQVITGRFIKMLEDESKKDADKYKEFFKNFSIFIKEGVAADFKNREQLAKLLRFESSATEKGELTTLDDYVSRMKEEQKEIYYLYAPNRETIDNGPHLEAFKAHGIEVLYLYEPVDEFVMTSLVKYADKDLVSADNSDIELEEVTSGKKKKSLSQKDSIALCEWIKETLGDAVNDVSVSKRLVDSPAIALNADKVMTPSMRRMMKAMKQDVNMQNSVNLEINTNHELIKNLSALKDKDADTAKLVTQQILDNTLIAAGYLEDPRDMVSRVYQILERVSAK